MYKGNRSLFKCSICGDVSSLLRKDIRKAEKDPEPFVCAKPSCQAKKKQRLLKKEKRNEKTDKVGKGRSGGEKDFGGYGIEADKDEKEKKKLFG